MTPKPLNSSEVLESACL